ncbi:MAG: VanZ family protein [Halanaeroarchaeum sp.]
MDWRPWAPVIGGGALLLSGSLLPLSGSARVPPVPALDALLHAGGFALLVGLGAVSVPKRRVSLLVGGAIALAIGIEVAQTGVPGRRPEAIDVLADLIGIALGLVAARIRNRAGATRL